MLRGGLCERNGRRVVSFQVTRTSMVNRWLNRRTFEVYKIVDERISRGEAESPVRRRWLGVVLRARDVERE